MGYASWDSALLWNHSRDYTGVSVHVSRWRPWMHQSAGVGPWGKPAGIPPSSGTTVAITLGYQYTCLSDIVAPINVYC